MKKNNVNANVTVIAKMANVTAIAKTANAIAIAKTVNVIVIATMAMKSIAPVVVVRNTLLKLKKFPLWKKCLQPTKNNLSSENELAVALPSQVLLKRQHLALK